MAEYNNTRDSSLPDPASPGFQDGDTITLLNGAKFSRQSGRWEPVRFQTVGQQSNEVPVTAIPSELGTELYAGGEVLALPGGVQVPSDWNAVAGVARILNKPTVLDAEAVQELVAAMFAGSHTNLTATYNDATGTLTLSAASGGGGTTAEEVQDFLNTSLVHASHTGVTVSYDDANNRFVFTAVSNSSVTGITFTNGQVTGWTVAGVTYAATYGANGLTSITKGGQPFMTVTYTNGLPTAVTYA